MRRPNYRLILLNLECTTVTSVEVVVACLLHLRRSTVYEPQPTVCFGFLVHVHLHSFLASDSEHDSNFTANRDLWQPVSSLIHSQILSLSDNLNPFSAGLKRGKAQRTQLHQFSSFQKHSFSFIWTMQRSAVRCAFSLSVIDCPSNLIVGSIRVNIFGVGITFLANPTSA